MRGLVHFGAAILAVFGVACASNVNVSIEQRGDLAGYRTWNFLGQRSEGVRARPSDMRELAATLTRLVERCLAERGFARVTGTPDLYVSYFLDVKRQVEIVTETPTLESLFSLNHSPSYEIQTTRRRRETHELGQLTIFVTDRDERAVIWRGGFEGRFRGALSPHLKSAVASLLGWLPASALAPEARLDGSASGRANPASECQPGI